MSLKKIINKTRKAFSKISLRTRLVALFIFIFGATTIIFNTFVFLYMIQALQRDFDDALFNYAVDVTESVIFGKKGDLTVPPLEVDYGKILPFPLGTAIIEIRHSSGEILARVGDFGSFNPSYKKALEKIKSGEDAYYQTINAKNVIPNAEADSYRIITFAIDNNPNPQFLLQIAAPMTLMETQISKRLFILQIGIPLVLIIAALTGLYFSTRAMAPINQIISTINKIDANDLSQRVPIPESQDEIREMALKLNELLLRIQNAFFSQERFVADASHQLLTPLTILRGEIERLPKNSQNIEEQSKSLLQEVDQLTNIIKDMLLLSRVDAGLGALNMQNLEMDELIIAAISSLEKLATTKNIKINFNLHGEQSHPVRGDADLLDHLLHNLIENSIKYSPANDTISVILNWEKDYNHIIIKNNGPGLPNELIQNQSSLVFNRFSRGKDAQKNTKGFGLGLAIAKKIAELHHAKLYAAENISNGAEFHFEIKNI